MSLLHWFHMKFCDESIQKKSTFILSLSPCHALRRPRSSVILTKKCFVPNVNVVDGGRVFLRET